MSLQFGILTFVEIKIAEKVVMKIVDEIAFYFPFQRRRRRCCDLHLFGSCIAFFPLLKMTKKCQ